MTKRTTMICDMCQKEGWPPGPSWGGFSGSLRRGEGARPYLFAKDLCPDCVDEIYATFFDSRTREEVKPENQPALF